MHFHPWARTQFENGRPPRRLAVARKAAVAIDEYSISSRVFYIDENTSRLACNSGLLAANFANLLPQFKHDEQTADAATNKFAVPPRLAINDSSST
jgi:hypothetical protein